MRYFAPKGAGERMFSRWRVAPASAKIPLRKNLLMIKKTAQSSDCAALR